VQFRGVAICNPNQGDTLSLWDDIINGVIHFERFPHLLQFAKDPVISLWSIRHSANRIECFMIPMSRTAYNEFLELQEFVIHLPPIDPDLNDSWHYNWGQQRYRESHYY
jgi:hypothetical protein